MPYTETTVVERTEYYAPVERNVDFEMPEVDSNYVKTLGGIMKIICIVLDILCLLCVFFGGPAYFTGAGWATFVTTTGCTITLILLLLYILKIVDSIVVINWIIVVHFSMHSISTQEMVYTFIWMIFFFIAGSILAVAAVQYEQTAGWAVASFFAFGAMCAYGFDCYLKFLQWKHDERATGDPSQIVAQQKRRHTGSEQTA